MSEPIQTNRFTVDRPAYLRTMYTYNLWRPLATIVFFAGILIAGSAVLIGPSEALGGGIGVLIALPFVFVLRYFMARRNIYSRESRQVFDDPRTITFSAQGAHLQTEGGVESQVPWSHVVKVVQRGGFTLLFMGRTVHVVVPDQAFASSDDRQTFLELLKEPVGKGS